MEMSNATLLATARTRAIDLLVANCTDAGVLAAGRSTRAHERGYEAIFGRDAAVCALGMLRSGDDRLVRAAASAAITLGQHQARNGQIPKFVDTTNSEADFWYLGCIDATLWWLIHLHELSREPMHGGILDEHAHGVARALDWLLAQEHQRFFLLQQNEASDWADIMPRSGFVLYTNALWYYVKRIFRLEHADGSRANFNGLFHPFSATLAEYRRARLLADYALQTAKRRDLYLSFVNFSFFGEEGDVFGNALALLAGLADPPLAAAILDTLSAEQVHEPYPVRVVCEPILQEHFLAVPQWRHLADGRWLLDLRARSARQARSRTYRAREACARVRAERLGIQRMATRRDIAALRHAAAVVECGRFLVCGRGRPGRIQFGVAAMSSYTDFRCAGRKAR